MGGCAKRTGIRETICSQARSIAPLILSGKIIEPRSMLYYNHASLPGQDGGGRVRQGEDGTHTTAPIHGRGHATAQRSTHEKATSSSRATAREAMAPETCTACIKSKHKTKHAGWGPGSAGCLLQLHALCACPAAVELHVVAMAMTMATRRWMVSLTLHCSAVLEPRQKPRQVTPYTHPHFSDYRLFAAW